MEQTNIAKLPIGQISVQPRDSSGSGGSNNESQNQCNCRQYYTTHADVLELIERTVPANNSFVCVKFIGNVDEIIK